MIKKLQVNLFQKHLLQLLTHNLTKKFQQLSIICKKCFTKTFLIDDFDEISWNIKKEIGIARYNSRQNTAFDFACNLLLLGAQLPNAQL